MPSGTVTVVMKAADAELLRAWQRAKEGPQQMAEELQKVSGKSRQLRSESSATFSTIIGGFTAAAISSRGFTHAMGLAHRAVHLLRQEYDEFLTRQKSAAGFQGEVAPAQRAALRNLGEDLTGQEMTRRAEAIQGETGADLAAVYNAISSTLSARGDMTSGQAIEQVGAVVKLDPSLVAKDLADLAGGTLDIRKAFEGTTPEQAIGGVLAGQQTARVTETGQYARNIVPAVVGLHNFGMEFREASAMLAAITQESADVEGARSGTAGIQFAKQITTATASVKELQGKGLTERLDYLLSGDKQAEQIRRGLVGAFDQELVKAGYTEKGELTGEAKQYTALIGLLTAGSHTRQLYEAALQQTPELSEAQKVYQRNLELQEGLGVQRTKKTEEIFRGAVQRRQADEAEGILGATHEGLERYLTQLGSFGATNKMPGAVTRFGEMTALQNVVAQTGRDPRLVASVILERRLQAAEASGAVAAPGGVEKAREVHETQRALTEAALRDSRRRGDEAQTQKLIEVIERQNKLLERIEKNTADDAVRLKNPGEPTRAARRGQARPAPIAAAGG